MSASSPGYRLAFLGQRRPARYGDRFARWRWWSAYGSAGPIVEIAPDTAARARFDGPSAWLLVRDGAAVPLAPESPPDPRPGKVLAVSGPGPSAPAAHTLREIEEIPLRRDLTIPASAASRGSHDPREAHRGIEGRIPAVIFRPEDFPPADSETAADYVDRLCGHVEAHAFDARFAALAPEDPFRHERPEVTRHFPHAMRRLLDVGCGAGEAGRALKRAMPLLQVTGIESDAAAAVRAREKLDCVLEGDALEMLSRLLAEGARFDGFLFADVLEHLEDPIGALAKARALAEPGATLAVSVPNAGHLSLVRDLILGRFDPVPAGLGDEGHLRWFTRSFLSEALEEARWEVVAVEALPGAPAPDAEAFLSWLSAWPGANRETLSAYQWVAVARPGGTRD